MKKVLVAILLILILGVGIISAAEDTSAVEKKTLKAVDTVTVAEASDVAKIEVMNSTEGTSDVKKDTSEAEDKVAGAEATDVAKTDVKETDVVKTNVEETEVEDTSAEIKETPEAEETVTEVMDVAVTKVKKCGVNTFGVSNDCGVGAFKEMYVQCYDGYEEKHGGESSCKSSETWQEYAKEACEDRCTVVDVSVSISKPAPILAPAPTAISVCYMSDELAKEYNELILELDKAESAGYKDRAADITLKIIALKQEIAKSQDECASDVSETKPIQTPTVVARPVEPVVIDRCSVVDQWKDKIGYYEKLMGLSDSDLKMKTGFSRDEIEKILSELTDGLEKVKAQCDIQTGTVVKPSITAIQIAVAKPIKPVVAESGQEVELYYKAQMKDIVSSSDDVDVQVGKLKALRDDIDHLIEGLIKGRKEIESGELSNLVTEVKVSPGEIRADNIVVKTLDTKILMDLGNKPVSINPTASQVLIKDRGLEVMAAEVSIVDNVLKVGNSEVKVAASDVADKLQILPKSVELREENAKSVYKMKIDEKRKLFGIIPVNIEKSLTVDAANGDLLEEKRPWYAFLTTK